MRRNRFLILFTGFLIYSLVSVVTKSTAGRELFSTYTLSRYLVVLILLIVYSVLWQISLRNLDLSVAYMGKGSVIIFGMIWAVVFFKEAITVFNIIGAGLILGGIALFSLEKQVKI